MRLFPATALPDHDLDGACLGAGGVGALVSTIRKATASRRRCGAQTSGSPATRRMPVPTSHPRPSLRPLRRSSECRNRRWLVATARGGRPERCTYGARPGRKRSARCCGWCGCSVLRRQPTRGRAHWPGGRTPPGCSWCPEARRSRACCGWTHPPRPSAGGRAPRVTGVSAYCVLRTFCGARAVRW
ncbi:hypothetical protein GZL_07940 [Streptomyces sp. 769]|nr:hypothetical protein GZL_07940 [Streptomyces sp. 769]